MNMRAMILKAALVNPGLSLQEIAAAIGEKDEKRARANVDVAVSERLLMRKMDEVTRHPGYWITDLGRQRLSSAKGGEARKRASIPVKRNEPQPEAGDNTGSDGSAVNVPAASTEAVAVQESAPEPEATQAPVAEDERTPDFARDPELQYLAPEDYEMPPADPVLLASANRELSKQCDAWRAVAARFECYTPEGLAEHVANLHTEAAGLHEDRAELEAVHDILAADLAPESDPRDPSDMNTEDLARVVLEHLNAERRNAVALATKLQHLLDSKTHECEALRAELANTQKDSEQAVDVLDAAHGYLVKAPKRKPRFLTQPEAARNAAMACARNGSGRGDVYALVHVGTAKRGAEWTEPN